MKARRALALTALASSMLAGCALVFGIGDVVDTPADGGGTDTTPPLELDGRTEASPLPPVDAGDASAPPSDADADVDVDAAPIVPLLASAGLAASCTLTKDRALYCWGSNGEGIVGANDDAGCEFGFPDASTNQRPRYACQLTPHLVDRGPFADVSVGALSACVVRAAGGTVECAGADVRGVLGGATTASLCTSVFAKDPTPCAKALVPVPLSAASFDRVVVGRTSLHACAWNSNGGNVWCWGDDAMGQASGRVPDGGTTVSPPRVVLHEDGTAPVLPLDLVIGGRAEGSPDPVYAFTCAILTDHSLWCWGKPSGDVSLGGSCTGCPRKVRLPGGADLKDVSSVATANASMCATYGSNPTHVHCWGDNKLGQLGSADGTDFVVEDGSVLRATNTGYCAIGPTTAKCWGGNELGELIPDAQRDAVSTCADGGPLVGIGACLRPSTLPIPARTSLALGSSHVIALVPLDDGGVEVQTWGANLLGVLGTPPFIVGEAPCAANPTLSCRGARVIPFP